MKTTKRITSLLLTILMIVGMVPTMALPVSAGASASEIEAQITNTYAAAKKMNNGNSFNGWCGKYVGLQLQVLGINTSYYGGNGNNQFDNYKNMSKTTGGYQVTAYPASSYTIASALNAITQNGTKDAYNILVGFQTSSGEDGKLYGHVNFIHAILGGTVYYSESYSMGSGSSMGAHSEGTVITCSISKFASYYNSFATLDGIIKFTGEDELAYTVSYNANGGSGAPAAQTKTKGTALTLSSTKPTRTGYDFLGWSTSSAATDATYSAGASYSTDASVTLYAVWKIKTYTITWVIDGKSETTTVNYGAMPTHAAPVKASDSNYTYSFTGWEPTVVNATANATYTAKFSKTARLPGESDWVPESQVPAGAKITDTKWVYTKTETKESTATSMSGWTQIGSRWEQTGTGSSYYATFPSGFDTSHSIYTSFMKAPYSASETTTNKRTVSNEQVGYVYYHWAQNITGLSSETTWHNRSVEWSKTGSYTYFFAMTDTRNFSYVNSATAYQYPGATSGGSKPTDLSKAATYWFNRFAYYRSSYTDYQKVFTYQKVTTGLESASAITAGNGISDVKKYVKYIASYNVTWNIDGKTTTESYTYGATPSHSTPTKAADAQYTYTFTGWSPAITTVTSNVTYTAQFSKTVRNYTITWNVDGKTTTESYTYGSMPSHANPTKEADVQYTYTFTGWSPAISTVTGNATYTAQFSKTLRNYLITWSIDGISSTETYAYGVTPTPDNPVKESDAQYDYTFTGWSPAITAVTGNATYTAQFSAEPIVADADLTVSVKDVTISKGQKTVTIEIVCEGEVPVVGYEYALSYDTEHFTFQSADHFPTLSGAKYGSENITGKSGYPLVLSCTLNPGSATRFGGGVITRATFTVADDTEAGDYSFGICADGSGTTVYDMQGTTAVPYEVAFVGGKVTVQDYIIGDCNGDGNISIMDVTVLLLAVSGTVEPEPFGAFDVFADKVVSILDVTALLTFLSKQ